MKTSNILLVLDAWRSGQAKALRHAAALARIEGAILTICEVVEWPVPEVSRYLTEGSVRILNGAIRANKIERLKELIATNGDSDLDISIKFLVGKPHIEVARLVRENQHDLVIKPVSKRRVMRNFLAIHEDREFIKNCPCSVCLVEVAEQDDNGCILAALDMPAAGELESELNQRIVRISRSIALSEGRPLHYVHPWHLHDESHMRAQRSPATNEEVDRTLVCEMAKRKAWLQNSVSSPRSDMWQSSAEEIAPELHILGGHARKVIPDLANELGAGIVVVGNQDHTGIADSLPRHIAETILPSSNCSLFVVKKPESLSSRVTKRESAIMVS